MRPDYEGSFSNAKGYILAVWQQETFEEVVIGESEE